MAEQTRLFPSKLSLKELEQWLWDAACSIRGPVDAPKFRDYILPLLFFKRLSDVYEDEITRLNAELNMKRLLKSLLLRTETSFVFIFLMAALGRILEKLRRILGKS